MTERFTENEVVTTITRLTRRQLHRFVEGELVRPEQTDRGYVFRQIDIARLELLCDLSLDLNLDDGALCIVISLLDQLHAARQKLALVARAIDTLPDGVRDGLMAALNRA
jgi:chaperone modulatory protein CbpM